MSSYGQCSFDNAFLGPSYKDSSAAVGTTRGFFNRAVHRQPTTMADAFLSDQNIRTLKSQVEAVLSNLAKKPVKVEANDLFLEHAMQVAYRNPAVSFSGNAGLEALNNTFVTEEVEVQWASIRHGLLYEKWVLNNDRQRVMPYGEGTHVTRGDVTIAPSGYQLSNPWRRQFRAFACDVLHAQPSQPPQCDNSTK